MKLKEHDSIYVLNGEVRCSSCAGTGLYSGMGEKKGAAVICYTCKGTGVVDVNLKWIKFKGRKRRDDVKRVYTNGMGYGITHEDITTDDGRFMPFSQYGCSYEEWLRGVKPIPLKFLGCPYQETDQGLQSKDVNDLYKTRCEDKLGWGAISNCKLNHDKAKCWEIYEKKEEK